MGTRGHLKPRNRTSRWGARLAAAFLIFGLVGTPGLAAAADGEYTSGRKAGRGMANLTLGFLALPGQMIKETNERGPGVGLPLGFAMGLGWIVVTELIGAYELLSSPFEVPAGFEPLIEPEFPWDYFDALED